MIKLLNKEITAIRSALPAFIHPYMERAFQKDRSGISFYTAGPFLVILFLESAAMAIRIGEGSPAETIELLSRKPWSTLLVKDDDNLSIPCSKHEKRYLMTVTKESFIPSDTSGSARELTSYDEFILLAAFYLNEGNMGFDSRETPTELADSFLRRPKPFRAAGVFSADKLVSAAYISQGTDRSAMLSGVATEYAYRGNGFASLAVSTLLKLVFDDGMENVSLWPEGKTEGMYRRLGFFDNGCYSIFRR